MKTSGAILIGILGGFLLAVVTFRVEVWVDYDSGDLRRESTIGWLTIRTERINCQFYSLRMANGQKSLNSSPDWHRAYAFSLNSKVSPKTRVGDVVALMKEAELVFEVVPRDSAARFKQNFLEVLPRENLDELKNLVNEFRNQKWERKSPVDASQLSTNGASMGD